VVDKLVRIQRNFLWGWGAEGRKIAWASWKKVCKPRELGGLGVIDLKLFNLALLGKWIWRLGTDKGGLWKEILISKYGGWRSLRGEGKSSKCSLWWKDLKEVWASEGWAEVLKMVSSGKSVMERKFLSGRTGGSVVVR